MSLLEIRNLTVEFDTAMGPFRALKGVDYTVDKGEVLAIVGESGSGKSVAMLATMGLLPDSATVKADVMSFDGRDLKTVSPKERRSIIGKDISMIFQEPIASLNPCFTVGFQIGGGSENPSRSTRQGHSLPHDRIARSCGHSHARKTPVEFSAPDVWGGQCQRVMIAMAICLSAQVAHRG